MPSTSPPDFFLQRWTKCLACGSNFEHVLYRCLQCSDLSQSSSSSRSHRSDSVHSRTASTYMPASTSTLSQRDASEWDHGLEDRSNADAFHICPVCVRKASLFHPVRHVFVRVHIPMLMQLTNTSNPALRPDENDGDFFDTPDLQNPTHNPSCTLGRIRMQSTTTCDALAWERFIHARIMEAPNLRTIKTISTKYHLESCDRCHSRICGIRWERVCTPAGEQHPKAILTAPTPGTAGSGLVSSTTPPPFASAAAAQGLTPSGASVDRSLSSDLVADGVVGGSIAASFNSASSSSVSADSPPSSSMLSYTQGDPFIESEQVSSPQEIQVGSSSSVPASGVDSKNQLPAASATSRDQGSSPSAQQRNSPFGGLSASSLHSLATSVASVFSAATAPIIASVSPSGHMGSSKNRRSIPPSQRRDDSITGATGVISDHHSHSTPSLASPPSHTHQQLAATTTGVIPSHDRIASSSLATSYASTSPFAPQQPNQPPKRALSLCMHCFDTLHSDFGLTPLSHRKVPNQEHDDDYYKGYLWAHVRCLFDSATQPLIPTLADEEEIAKADATARHHHSHSHRNTWGSGNALKDNLHTSEGFIGDPSSGVWGPRHIGSDQSIHSSSSGAESGTSSFPVSESSGTSRADAQAFVMSNIKIPELRGDSSSTSGSLDEWVLMEAIPHSKLDLEYMSDEERSNPRLTRSDDSYDEELEFMSQHSDTSDSSGDEKEETIFDAGKRQALNFLVQDDVMRPAELSAAIQPFIQSIEPSTTSTKKKKDGPSSLSTLAQGSSPAFLTPDPVFELTPDLQSELAAHKARSVFEYGLNRDSVYTTRPVQTLGGLPPLSALSSLDIVVDPVMPPTPSSYGGAYGASSYSSSAPTAYPSIPALTAYSSTDFTNNSSLPTGYAAGDQTNGYLASHDTTSGYGAPTPFRNTSNLNPYSEPTPQRLSPIPAPSSITPYMPSIASDDGVHSAPDSPKFDPANQPSSDVPFAVPTPPTATAGSYSEATPMKSEPESDEHNDPYFTDTSNFVPSSANLASNEPDNSHRDWNGEWQALVQELRGHTTDTLHTLVTEPRSLEEVWERERSMSTLLHEAGILSVAGLDKLYAPESNMEYSGSSETVATADGSAFSPDDDSIIQIAKDFLNEARSPAARIERLSERLNEMTHLKADKSRASLLMLCLLKVRSFLDDFMDTASRIAKTIVFEMTLPVEAKTVKPRNLGGIAGGEKYLEEGIFFKFAIDAYNVYGGDKFAMKAAAHELQGIKAFAEGDFTGLFVPLSMLIDYAGYRLVASVRLPISQQTLIYGSSDGGATIHQKDPIFNRLMEEAATHLNLKQHEVAPGISLYSAVDMEGHKGTDGRYYILDTARVFPPEPPLRTFIAVSIPNDTTSSHKWSPSPPIGEIELVANRARWLEQVHTHLLTGHRNMTVDDVSLLEGQVFFLEDPHRTLPLNSRASALAGCVIRGPAIYVVEPGQGSTQLFNLLRAPYVARQPHALSSDSFTSFGRINQDIHNTEVEDAFYRLLGIDIPNFVKYITLPENSNTLTHDLLISTIKNFGINLRLLGFLRSHIPFNSTNRALRSMILVEMVTRVAKNDLRASLRSARSIRRKEMCFTPQMSERQAHEIVLSTFNLLLGNSTSSTFMWHSFMKTHIISKYGQYGQALTEAELDPSYDLRNEVNKLQLFQTLQHHVGVKFKGEVLVKFQQHPEYFEVSAPFGPEDIEELLPKRKTHLEFKIHSYFCFTMKSLPTITMRLEAARGFWGAEGRELGYAALHLAHVLQHFEATRHLVPPAVETALQIFEKSPGTTPAEVTAKAFFLLSSASTDAGNLDLAEAQLKASYNSYRRALSNHISGRPLEVGAAFLLIVLDRLLTLMDRQHRCYESWFYAQKFIRIWQSVPYPGDVKDLEAVLGRPSPLAFALLWERDYFLSAGQSMFLSNGQVVDHLGNIYKNTEDLILSQKTGRVFLKSNLADENLQDLPEISPEARLALEKDLFKDTNISTEEIAYLWRSTFKTIDSTSVSGYHMSASIWNEYIKTDAWRKDRLFDGKTMRRAVWTPSTTLLYNTNITRPQITGPNPTIVDEEELMRMSPAAVTSPAMDASKTIPIPASKPASLSNTASHTSITASSGTQYSAATLMTGSSALTATSTSIPASESNMYSMYASSASAPAMNGTMGPSTQPCLPASITSPNASPLAGTIRAPHVLKSGKHSKFTFNWHLAREWSREITGTEYFVLVRYEPNVWVLPAFATNSRSSIAVTREGKRILTGPEIGQFIEGQHAVIASMPARLMRTFGCETWSNLDLDWGFYQVHIVTAAGELWGKTTSLPCFVLSNMTVVLNRASKHHVLRWTESANWMSSVMQAQGIAFTNMSFIPLGSGYGTAYWTDANNQLWYGFSEPNAHIPTYIRQALPTEEIQRLQMNPLIVPMPSDFAQTFQQVAQILGPDIGALANETQSNFHNSQQRRQRSNVNGSTSTSANGSVSSGTLKSSGGSKSGTLTRTLSPPNISVPLSHSTSAASTHSSHSHAGSSNTISTATNGSNVNNVSSFAAAGAAAGAAALSPSDLERAQSASSFSTGSRSSSSKSRSVATSTTSKTAPLSETFWKDQAKPCEASNCAQESSVLHFDLNGARVPAGPLAANSVIVLKSVESQLTQGMMWAKMRKVPSLSTEKVVKVVASNSHVMALLANGDVFTWGNNLYGELGHGDLVRLEEPRVVKRLRGKQVRDIAVGVGRSVALLAGNRAVYQWGLDFSLFPEPHPFWKSLPDEEVVKVVFQTQNGLGTPLSFEPEPNNNNFPYAPKEVPSYRIFETNHSVTTNPLWHSNLMIYLTDTGRAYLFGHDPYQLLFKSQKPILLDVAEDQPVLDAAIGSNFIAFIGEEGSVWTTGYNELGQRGTGVVGDATLDAYNSALSKSGSTLRTSGNTPKSRVESRYGYEEISAAVERFSRRAQEVEPAGKASALANHTPSRSKSVTQNGFTRPSNTKAATSIGSIHDAFRGRTRTSGTWTAAGIPDAQTIAWEEERENHPMNAATLPPPATKVTFTESASIVKIVVRSKKLIALTDKGVVWHWGNGVYIPTKVPLSNFSVNDIAIHPTGALFHTGSTPPPIQELSERGRTRRKALGLEKPLLCDIQARQMLWTPTGLKPWVEGSVVPSKCRVVVVIDWKRPPPSITDRAEEIRFVTPGSDKVENAPRSVSEISIRLPALPQRRGQYVVDYLNPVVKRWSIDQGIANGNLDPYLEPLLTWAPLTDESREVLLRRRDRKAAVLRQQLIDRQNQIIQEARALAEQRFNELRNQSHGTAGGPLSASSSFSNLPFGSASMPILAPSPAPPAAPSGVVSPVPSVTGAASSTLGLERPSPLHRRTSRASLLRGSSSGNILPPPIDTAVPLAQQQAQQQAQQPQAQQQGQQTQSQTQQQKPQPGSAASSTVGKAFSSSYSHSHTPSTPWDGSAAFLDIDSASSGIPGLLDDLSDSSIFDFNPEQEEYAPMIPPGEYEVVLVSTKPSVQILTRSKPVRFTYEGIKATIEVENTTLIGEKHIVAHWKCDMKLNGLKVVARDVETHKVVHSEPLLQRTQGTVRWRLRVGSTYRLYIERSDESEHTHALCESSTIEVLQAPTGFGANSMLAAINTMPMEVEICKEWTTFFRTHCELPEEFVNKYSALCTKAQIQTSFAVSLDSGFLDKLGITDIAHQVKILTAVHHHREAHVRAILAQELQKMLDSCGSCSQFDSASSSSLHN